MVNELMPLKAKVFDECYQLIIGEKGRELILRFESLPFDRVIKQLMSAQRCERSLIEFDLPPGEVIERRDAGAADQQNKLVPLSGMLPADMQDENLNLELNKALATINHFLFIHGRQEQQAAFQWVCDHVVFIPVAEKGKNLSLVQLLAQWLQGMLDREAEECAATADRLAEDNQELDLVFAQAQRDVARDIRKRKGTKRSFI